jgi:hypothetical protein
MRDEVPDDDVNPTVRWLVHGVWRIALGIVVILIVIGVAAAILR